MIIPVFLPYLGCQGRCIFCNQHLQSNNLEIESLEKIVKRLNSYLGSWRGNKSSVELAFYAGSVLNSDLSLVKTLISEARQRGINQFRISTRPDYISQQGLATIKQLGITCVELGVPSFDDHVLELSGRGHSSSQAIEALELLQHENISVVVQIMAGLPEQTREVSRRDLKMLLEIKPEMVRFSPTLVLNGTKLAELYLAGQYQPLSLNQAVEIGADFSAALKIRGIRLIRCGIFLESAVWPEILAGPQEPGFGDLVNYRIMTRALNQLVIEKKTVEISGLTFNSRQICQLTGYRKLNLELIDKAFENVRINFKKNCKYDIIEVETAGFKKPEIFSIPELSRREWS